MTYFDEIFTVLQQFPDHHARETAFWKALDSANETIIRQTFGKSDDQPRSFGPFGAIALPYFEMGAITSLELFGLDELILFAFYDANRERYSRTVDFGANIGLHSIVMSRCGFDVRSFEPDPIHSQQFEKNAALNGVHPELHKSAISLEDGEAEFVRVLGNTTGSHIKGAKTSPYGELETFTVKVEAAVPHLEWADLAKIDIEGHEADLIEGIPLRIWQETDALLEVGTPENAERIFEHLHGQGPSLFAQKIGWRQVTSLEDMPTSYRDGTLFLTGKAEMPWTRA